MVGALNTTADSVGTVAAAVYNAACWRGVLSFNNAAAETETPSTRRNRVARRMIESEVASDAATLSKSAICCRIVSVPPAAKTFESSETGAVSSSRHCLSTCSCIGDAVSCTATALGVPSGVEEASNAARSILPLAVRGNAAHRTRSDGQ